VLGGLWRWFRGNGGAASDAELGKRGERLAARTLKKAGYRILGRNVRLRVGEADLVCLAPDRTTIVVVEVKTRGRGEGLSAMGQAIAPEASVHAAKRRKLVAVSRALARANGWEARCIRIDVVAIEWPRDGSPPVIRHHQGAVGGGR
jgi:putative endonuclease